MKNHTCSNCSAYASRVWLLATTFCLAGTLPLAAHVGAPPLSAQGKTFPLGTVQQLVLPTTDVAAELAKDATTGKAAPLRYAVPQPVMFTTTNSGTWEQLPEGRLWRLRVVSTNATDLNFGFTQFWLPEGATLYVISEFDKSYRGPYTAADNTPAGQLWTPVVPGDAAVIELLVPDTAKQEPRLMLTQVATGYRDMFHLRKDGSIPKAGSCEIDVVCPQAAPWANEIRAVGRISIGGSGLCSGTLIMDAASDFRPFFLTANHCGIDSGNAASCVVYWNYQSAVCGNHGLSPTNSGTTSGSTFRASKYDVDFCLIELSQSPPSSDRPYYAGWDRSGNAPSLAVGIHHPNADGKCISFSSSGLTTLDSCIGTGGSSTHWQVPWYDGGTYGVTEPGSSGSGIFDANSHQLVGTLSGGPSSCTTTSGNFWDCYGKFAVAWASGSSSLDRLEDWLDPQNTGVMSVAGSDPVPTPAVTLAGTSLAAEGCPPGNGAPDPGEVVTYNVSLRDSGTAPTTNLVATLLATNGVTPLSGPQTYGALAAGGTAVARAFTFMPTGACGGTFTAVLQLQDGPRNLGTVSFSMPMGVQVTSFSENFDGVSTPNLPPSWTSSPSGIWATTSAQRDTLPNSTFAPDIGSISDYQLISPVIPINSPNAQLSFRHYYDTESTYDGAVLEISINGGVFVDILSAGGSFISGGYNATISTTYGNPLAGRAAWSGNSGGFITTSVALPAAAAGGSIQLSWRLGNDNSVSMTGWYVDTITVSGGYSCCTGAPPASLSAPFYNRTNSSFRFNVAGGTGYSYTVLTSTNLSNWVALGMNVSPFTFTHTNAGTSPRRFYRVRYP